MRFSYRIHLILIGLVLAILTACAPAGIRQGPGEYISDAIITSRVKAAFATDPQVKAREVHVETYMGTVQLTGFVESPESAARAVQLARAIPRVRDVQNALVTREQHRQ